MKYKIVMTDRNERKALMEHFSVSATLVSNALNFTYSTLQHWLIRNYAMNTLHGILVTYDETSKGHAAGR